MNTLKRFWCFLFGHKITYKTHTDHYGKFGDQIMVSQSKQCTRCKTFFGYIFDIETGSRKVWVLIAALALSSCASNPYWAIPHHDGIEKRTYMKRAWPIDQTCRTYTGNNPIQRKSWANQFYWKRK